jgi:hypothetical protein
VWARACLCEAICFHRLAYSCKSLMVDGGKYSVCAGLLARGGYEGDCACLVNVFPCSRGWCGLSVVLWCGACVPRALCDLEKFAD